MEPNYLPDLQILVNALLDGDVEKSIACAKDLVDHQVPIEEIIMGGIEEAMSRLDAKCTVDQFNLLEIMLAGRATMAVVNFLFPAGHAGPGKKGKVVVASLEGDVHDLGKNIVRMVLTAHGYNVIDCGKDCQVAKVIDAAIRESAIAIAISGLITSVTTTVGEIKRSLAGRGVLNIRVLAGGAALKQFSARDLNVDFVGDTVFDGKKFLEDLGGARHESH